MDNQHQHSFVSPLFIALLGFMSAALLLAVYHCLVNNFFNPRRSSPPNDTESSGAQLIVGPTKLFGKGEGESVCAVCLCEFADSEEVRLMPECLHYFHVACIDMWLRSHSSCPMCRAETTVIALPPAPADSQPARVSGATVVGSHM